LYIDVFATAGGADPGLLAGKTVLIIDVLRATSTITTALANGAAGVLPVLTIAEAREAAAGLTPRTFLLGGERKALKIPGFDLDNSPRQYTREVVAGKTIIMTTTNGTVAIKQAFPAAALLIASFLNARAAAREAWKTGTDIYLLCAGTRNRFSLDDAACAGLLVHCLQELEPGARLGDLAFALRHLYLSYRDDLPHLISHASHYQRLMDLGLEADIAYCLQQDVYDVVPRWDKERNLIVLPLD